MINSWYWIIAGIIGGPMLIAIIVLAWKMIIAGISPDKRNEVKDNIMRLFFGAIAIILAPMFVKLMLLLNNNLVKMLVSNAHGSLDDLLGNSLLTSINTGNAIATSIVIALFAYLFVKINIKFIIRQFTLIVFTIFTPIVSIFWIINKKTVASSIWFGQIFINSFMQFVYAFLFLIYLSFLPSNAGWAISLLWGMMILPLADALQNTMQNLVSRIAGINNEELANRGIGMGAAMGYTIKSIAYQFKGNNEKDGVEKKSDFISMFKNKTNNIESKPIDAKSYESYSKNIMEDENNNQVENPTKLTNNKINNNIVSKEIKNTNNASGIKRAFNIGKEFMNLGMYMAEGRNFKTNSQEPKQQKTFSSTNISNIRENDDEKEENKKIITLKVDDDNDN